MSTKPLFAGTDFLNDLAPLPAKKAFSDTPVSVSELSLAIKNKLENDFPLVCVKGEIFGFKKASSGHAYFSLKDSDAVIDAICWRGTLSKLPFIPEDGMEVVCKGKIAVYPSRSKYQIVIDHMSVSGEGALLKILEDRKKKLASEGLFDASRKKKIPFLPEVIGVVTSPSGAVIRDIMHRLNDRFPRRVLLWGCLVQGENAAEQIAAGIRGFNAIDRKGLPSCDGIIPRPDVIIVARGGGSLEDLWPFNEEIVARAAAQSDIPLISAVGHETDTTLIDYVADLRAPTPTGAAEKAVPVRLELASLLSNYHVRMTTAADTLLTGNKNVLTGLVRGLPSLDKIIDDYTQKLDDKTERLNHAVNVLTQQKESFFLQSASRLRQPQFVLENASNALKNVCLPFQTLLSVLCEKATSRLDATSRLLETCSYKSVLNRGFALVTSTDGKTVTSSKTAEHHSRLVLQFSDGSLNVSVQEKSKKRSFQTLKETDNNVQGSLF